MKRKVSGHQLELQICTLPITFDGKEVVNRAQHQWILVNIISTHTWQIRNLVLSLLKKKRRQRRQIRVIREANISRKVKWGIIYSCNCAERSAILLGLKILIWMRPHTWNRLLSPRGPKEKLNICYYENCNRRTFSANWAQSMTQETFSSWTSGGIWSPSVLCTLLFISPKMFLEAKREKSSPFIHLSFF